MLDTLLSVLGFAGTGGATAIPALVGAAGGGILRVIPEILKLMNAKADQAHEYRMRELDLKAAREGDERRLREAEQAGSIALEVKGVEAFVEAVKAQGQKTGFAIADILNALVRPVTTYYFLVLYGLAKAVGVFAVWNTLGHAAVVKILWTPADEAMLAGLFNFWFLGRVFDKKTARA